MQPSSRDLTISDVLSDPLIGAVMRADRIDRRDLEALLAAAARRVEAGRRAPTDRFKLPSSLRCFGRADMSNPVRETCG